MGIDGTQKGSACYLGSCFLIFFGVTVAVTLVRSFDVPLASFLVPVLWGTAALLPGWRSQTSPPALGLTGFQFKKGLRLFILSSIAVFPLYILLFHFSLQLGFDVPSDLIPHGVTVFQWIVYNFAVVALVEELFFRGYLQGCLEDYADRVFPGGGAAFWFPIVTTAFLFALAHAAADMDLYRMSVIFPGLLFGWLRARTGAILAPVLSHGAANLMSMLLIRSVS